jgi:ABC-type branched-subunit amino acid transport system substrate-binding protein
MFGIVKHIRARAISIVALTAVVTTVVACSANGTDAGGAASGAKGAIVIAGDASLTLNGSPFETITGLNSGAEARYWLANKQGGIDGHKIDFQGTLDDGGSAATLAGNLSKEVLQDKASIIAPYVSYAPFNPTFVSQNKVAIFGVETSDAMCASPWVFSQNGCGDDPKYISTDVSLALASAVMERQPVNGALTVPHGFEFGVQLFAGTGNDAQGLAAGAKANGWNACYVNGAIPTSATDFSTYAASVMRDCNNGKGPQGMAVGLGTIQATADFFKTMRTLGWKGTGITADYDPPALRSPDVAAGLVGTTTYFPNIGLPGTGNESAYATIKAALKGIGQPNTPITAGLLLGYATADMAVRALQKAGAGTSGRTLLRRLATWKYQGIPKVSAPVEFPQGRTFPVPCFNIVKVVGDHYAQLYPTLTCGQVLYTNGKLVRPQPFSGH